MKKHRVIALGTFDGVHLGHRKVIAEALAFAKKKNIPCAVITFDPHPQALVHPERQLYLLTTPEERKLLISKIGVDKVFAVKFNRKLRSMSCRDFAGKVLVKKLGASHVFVGMDYAFGRGREGNLAALRRMGKKFGFGVTGVRDKKEHGRVVKSTLVRNLMLGGHFGHAVKLLGHPYLLTGKVVKGRGVGQKIGYPTANIELPAGKLVPKKGVYASRIKTGKKAYNGVVNIGNRPTYGGEHVTIEAHLFGFKGDLNGKKVTVELVRRLRKEKRFPTVRQLVKAIGHDVEVAKEILA